MPREGAPAAGGQRASLSRTHRSSRSTGVERFPVPSQHLVVHVERVERRLEELHEGADADNVLRRAPPLAVDGRRVDVGLAIADRFDEDIGSPVVAEGVDVEEALDATLDERLQAPERYVPAVHAECRTDRTIGHRSTALSMHVRSGRISVVRRVAP